MKLIHPTPAACKRSQPILPLQGTGQSHLAPSGPSNGALAGRVVLVERLGGTSHVHLDVGPHRLLASVTETELPDVGACIGVRVPAERVHLFDADGTAVH